MIDFACKQFNLDDIIKCGLGLTKAELVVMKHFVTNTSKVCDTVSISNKLGLNLTTIQKAVKKLSEKNVLLKHQKNLANGGYIYIYEVNSKDEIRKILKGIIKNWSSKVNEKIDEW
jgi:predicted transcriptional regulator